MKLKKSEIDNIIEEEIIKLKENTVKLSTMKDANFEPGQFVQILGKKGKVTTRITPAGRKVQTVTGKSLTKKLKRTLTDKITGAGKDKARRLKRMHMFRRRPSKKLNK